MQWVLGELDLPTFPRCRTMMSVSNLRWGTWPRIQWGLPNQWISVGTPMMSSMFIASFHTHFPENVHFDSKKTCNIASWNPSFLEFWWGFWTFFASFHHPVGPRSIARSWPKRRRKPWRRWRRPRRPTSEQSPSFSRNRWCWQRLNHDICGIQARKQMASWWRKRRLPSKHQNMVVGSSKEFKTRMMRTK